MYHVERMSAYKNCPQCGEPAQLHAGNCLRCGHTYRTQFQGSALNQTQLIATQQTKPSYIQLPAGTHSVLVCLLLSILLAGSGQFYNRQTVKGIVLFFGQLFFALATCGFSLLITWPILIIDALLIAGKLERGLPVQDWEFF